MFGSKKKNKGEDVIYTPNKLITSLQRTRSALFGSWSHYINHNAIDVEALKEIEELMISADISSKTATRIIESLKINCSKQATKDELLNQLKQTLLSILKPVEQELHIPTLTTKPYLIFVVGVNGVGKTTTIGKLAKRLQDEGNSIMLAAGDTFRAAATEQLQIWGQRNDIRVIAQTPGADAGAVIYDALHSARANNIDVLIADTAGRLHNKNELMQEIIKIYRISDKFDDKLQREALLILDANTGQNALVQAKKFHEAIDINGIVLTKLDGSAKGGIVFSLANELNIPIRFIGIGEQISDLKPFNANEFVDALLDSNI